MFWKYTLFEMKLVLHNRKNWLLGLFLLLLFPVFFISYSQSDPVSLEDEKREEADMINAVLNIYPESYRETPEGEEVYENLLEQSSLINYQIYYFWMGDPAEEYIEDGLALNELRLRVHELGNKGVPEWGIKPEKEILKENALLRYIEEHGLPIETETLVTSQYLPVVLQIMGGLLFYFFVLISGSEVLVSEQRHRTVINGFPLSFMKRITSKIGIYFTYIYTFLVLGLLLGGYVAYRKAGFGDFSYPVLFYRNYGFAAISTTSTTRYLLYVLLAMALITIMTLFLSILLNILFKNAYANILIGFGLFLLPDLLRTVGVESAFLNPIKYVEISKVLSGDLAVQLGNGQIDYWHAIIWLVVLVLTIAGVIFAINKSAYLKSKEMRVNNA